MTRGSVRLEEKGQEEGGRSEQEKAREKDHSSVLLYSTALY